MEKELFKTDLCSVFVSKNTYIFKSSLFEDAYCKNLKEVLLVLEKCFTALINDVYVEDLKALKDFLDKVKFALEFGDFIKGKNIEVFDVNSIYKEQVVNHLAERCGVDKVNIFELNCSPNTFWKEETTLGKLAITYRYFSPQTSKDVITVGYFINI
jgi:hypothetical protein